MKTTAPIKKAGEARSASSPLPNAVTIALGLSLKRHRELLNKTQIELAYIAGGNDPATVDGFTVLIAQRRVP